MIMPYYGYSPKEMQELDNTESLLKAILAMLARQALPAPELFKIVTSASGGKKQVDAYNLCDGKTSQSEIVSRVGLDKGNLSRTISRWIEAGIVVHLGVEQHPLHVYPLPAPTPKKNPEKQ